MDFTPLPGGIKQLIFKEAIEELAVLLVRQALALLLLEFWQRSLTMWPSIIGKNEIVAK